jgi:hypothetical protein|uniref:Uncharacterized protein n=1 Tax=Picea glauca TaxID=3330 RepID=A0A117NGJ0_PICGL|nr:hypothetical protein ABT39_MTgene6336 [Picea glauca]QHR87030.1 hypothetical protein Q903MT_gene1039 [Picea sitchensis]
MLYELSQSIIAAPSFEVSLTQLSEAETALHETKVAPRGTQTSGLNISSPTDMGEQRVVHSPRGVLAWRDKVWDVDTKHPPSLTLY